MINTFNTLAITWDAFSKALSYQLTGMIVVFGCLVLLWIILSISGSIAVKMEEKRKAEAEAARAAAAAAAPAPAAPKAEEDDIFGEYDDVITFIRKSKK